ncbi:unnamed protein product [Candida verbasci]|uniref:Uncharacterized protein n=1 Tax=Candida verbasci TaxID=1227364 RepID=A0A9W4U1U5_9ASCO|nr:unnamed protein product [Candida verbasci]
MPKYKQVDVFSDTPYLGNPVAVIYDADSLSTSQMQKIANWTNLSETTFVCKPTTPEADYKLRIFTPGTELPFAGHPTIGTAHALIEDKLIKPKSGIVVQECGAGLIDIEVIDGTLYFTAPEYKFFNLDSSSITKSFGKKVINKPVKSDTGPYFAIFQFESPEDLLNINIDLPLIEKFSKENSLTGVGLFAEYNDGNLETRLIAPLVGVNEDPATGSLSGALGHYLKQTFDINQGRKVKRDCKIKVKYEDGKVKVGGNAITCFDGLYNS